MNFWNPIQNNGMSWLTTEYSLATSNIYKPCNHNEQPINPYWLKIHLLYHIHIMPNTQLPSNCILTLLPPPATLLYFCCKRPAWSFNATNSLCLVSTVFLSDTACFSPPTPVTFKAFKNVSDFLSSCLQILETYSKGKYNITVFQRIIQLSLPAYNSPGS